MNDRLWQTMMCVLLMAASLSARAADSLKWTLDSETGRIMVRRAEEKTEWRGEALAEVGYWDTEGKEHSKLLTPNDGWKIERRPAEHGFQLVCRFDELGFAITLDFAASSDVWTVAARAADVAETGAARLKTLRLLPRFGAASQGDEGHLVIAQQSGALCHFNDKKPGQHFVSVYQSSCQCPMPLFGMVRGNSAMAGIITSGQFDARICVSTNWGPQRHYAIDPVFTLRSFSKETRLSDDVSVEYHFLPAPEATWIGIGKRYRQFNFARRGLHPLRERAATSPALAYSAGALEVRIRLGVKPVPYDIKEQTPETEPPLRKFCDFARVRDILDEFHRQGIANTEFCLVGWNRGGHDGRYPQIFPVEPALGGEAELRTTIGHGQSLGYQMVAHDCYVDAYRISEDWNEAYLRKNPDGQPRKGGAWGGGQSYNTCLSLAHDLFAKRDLPRTRALGFEGLHYSDVLSIIGPFPCYDAKHPQTRRQDAEATVRILALAQKTFGGVQSEGSLDFTAPALDRLLYVDCDKWLPLMQRPYVDTRVPLFETVYHGTLLYSLSTDTVNSQPGEPSYLRTIEYGAAPLAYFYGHFVLDESKNWLGKRDYRYDDAAGLKQIVANLRRVYDDVGRLKHLQMEFIEGHRQLAGEVFETAYSNGQRVVVNYRESPFTLPSGAAIPGRGYVLLTDGDHPGKGATEQVFHVSPTGDDQAAGTQQAPFRTLHRAQNAVRNLNKDMKGDIVVSLAPGDYRLAQPLTFTETDSGRNGFRVIYRSAGGPGKARILGGVPLKGWQPFRDGIWTIDLPPKTSLHTLYENDQRAHTARFPDLERDPLLPTALGRYLVTEDGTPKQNDKAQPRTRGPGWLVYRSEDAPPVTAATKMRLFIFPGGKCDWVREVHAVTAIDPATRRLTFDVDPVNGVGVGARFFLEDELGFLNAPGEFFVDEKAAALYYKPIGKGHPDTLNIERPLLSRMIQFEGKSREQCVEHIVLDGLALGETDNSPPSPLWAYDGLRDGALIWLHNTTGLEIRQCRLKNGGRSGILMIGHNTGNLVTGCWIEHMGLNGVSLCNHFSSPDGKGPTLDRCEENRIHNTRISNVGELHTYAECVTLFNVSNNEVSHCDLDHSVRYAITLRGNTGPQYGPPVTTAHPPTRSNCIHHVRIARCGQDGGDMGALHAAALNNPGGGSVNVFEQITVADTAAIPSMKDIAPDGIFLDWPKMAMDQVFHDVQIVRSQGTPFRSHGPDNGASAQTENVSWKPGFNEDRMDFENIGLTAEFPTEFGGRPANSTALPAPNHLRGKTDSHDEVALQWDAVAGAGQTQFVISRDGREIGRTAEPRWLDGHLKERATYRYSVAARAGDFAHFGPASECAVATPADREPPKVTGVRVSPDGRRVRVAFNEPVEAKSSTDPSHYRIEPALAVNAVKPLAPTAVELQVDGEQAKTANQLFIKEVADQATAKNRITAEASLPVGRADLTVRYPLNAAAGGESLEDNSGGGGNAVLLGGARVEAGAGPHGGPALVLDGLQAYAEGPDDLNLGPGDFTLTVWVYRENGGLIVAKGNDFGQPSQWSFGLSKAGVPGSVSLRINNQFFATGERSVGFREWTHLAFVRRGNKGFTFVNGQPSGGPHDLSGIGPLVNDRPLHLGRRAHDPDPMFFKGRVAGLTIWPRALSPEEVRQEATAQSSK